METMVVIGIVAVAGVYVARVFYRKFRQSKSNKGGGACLGCSCSNKCIPDA